MDPRHYTPEEKAAICDDIVERLARGEPLAQICREDGKPHRSAVYAWADSDPELARRIAHAREDGEEWLAAECLQIADTPCEGVTEKWEPVEIENPDDPDLPKVTEFQLTERKVEDMLQHRKLQIDTRLKLLAKWNPKKWGEKVEHSGGFTLEQLVAGANRGEADG